MEILSKEFKEKVEKELKITDLSSDNQTNITIQHTYLQIFIEKKHNLYRIIELRDTVYQERYHHFRFDSNFSLKGAEIELYIKADEKYKKVNRIYNTLLLECEYLEQIVKLFSNRNFSLKNAIELEKMRQ